MRRTGIAGGLIAWSLLAPAALAQTLTITPAVVDSSAPVERALQENEGRASTAIEGQGGWLSLTYAASEPLQIFLAPLDADGGFVPTDFLRFTLPAADEADVLIDLTVSPGWSPAPHKWILHILTGRKDAEAGFLQMEFLPASPFATVKALFSHFFTVEPYTPSSYHALRGYRVFGTPTAPILGVVMLIAAAIAIVAAKKERKLPTLVMVLLAGCAFWQLRFSIDLLRFTHEHLTGYAAGLYDEAGSVYQAADIIREAVKTAKIKEEAATVYVCRDGTNYQEKILRYMSYPIRISSQEKDAATAAFVLVTDKKSWTLGTRTTGTSSVQTLNCGAVTSDAKKLTDFPDGSILFSIHR